MSVGAEEPAVENEQKASVYNAENPTEETTDTLEEGVNAVVEENNNETLENIENSETAAEEENITVEAPVQATNPSTGDETSDISENSKLAEVQQQPELGNFTYELIYNEDHTIATIIMEYSGECSELTLNNEDIITEVVNIGVYRVNMEYGDWVNTMAFDILVNGVFSFKINVWNGEELLETEEVSGSITGLNNDTLLFEPNQKPITYEIVSNDVGSSDSRNMTLSYETNVSFTWSIPTELPMADIEDDLTVTVNNSNLVTETALRIRVASNNNYNLVNSESGESLSYIITDQSGNLIKNDDVILDHIYNQDSSSNILHFDLTQMPVLSGKYEDTLCFTASVERLLDDLYSGQKIVISELGTTHNFTKIKIYGVGYQEQHQGLNLWDEQWEYGSYKGEPGEKVSKTLDTDESWEGIRSKNKIYLTPNETYYMCADFGVHVQTLFLDSDDIVIDYAPSKLYGYSFTVPENCAYVLFRTNSHYGSIYNNDIAIIKGNSGVYEPYCGGTPTPSPDNPSEIQSAVNPTIRVYDKSAYFNQMVINGNFPNTDNWNTVNSTIIANDNVLTVTRTSSSDFYTRQTVSVIAGHKYLLTGKCKMSTAAENALRILYDYGIGSYTQWAESTSEWQTVSLIFKPSLSYNGTVAVRMDARHEDNSFMTTDIMMFDLTEMGLDNINSAEEFKILYPDDYYQYNAGSEQGQIAVLHYVLNAIPVSSGGNIMVNGQQYISDYVDIENKKLVRLLNEAVLTISAIQTDRKYNTFALAYKPADYVGYHNYDANYETLLWEKGVLGKLTFDIEQPSGTISNTGSDGFFFIALPKSVTTQEEAEAMIGDSKILYKLSTPIEIDLTDAEVQAFKDLYTYSPATNISCSSDQLTPYMEFGLS